MSAVFFRKLRIAATPRNWLVRTRLANGALVAGYNRSGWGGRGAYIYRDALQPGLASLSHFLKPGHVFIDIGANVGVYSMKAAKEVGDSGIVIAVEPFLETALQLFRNANMNGFGNCRVRNFCIGGATGEAKFYLNLNKPNSYSLKGKSDTDSISVLAVSLNDLCEWEGLRRLDYLKIDVTCPYDQILAGGSDALHRFRPIIEIEVLKHQGACAGPSWLPPGYSRFSVTEDADENHTSNIFIPSERVDSLAALEALGWTPHGAGSAERARS